MSDWLAILLAGAGSYALRMSMLVDDRLRLPTRAEASVELVAPAAFSALAMTALATAVVNAASAVAAAPIAVAAVVAVVLTAWTGKPYASLLGLPAYWLTAALLGSSS